MQGFSCHVLKTGEPVAVTQTFHATCAVLVDSGCDGADVFASVNGKDFLIARLKKGSAEQLPLSLQFAECQEVTLFVTGEENEVHVSGIFIDDAEEESEEAVVEIIQHDEPEEQAVLAIQDSPEKPSPVPCDMPRRSRRLSGLEPVSLTPVTPPPKSPVLRRSARLYALSTAVPQS